MQCSKILASVKEKGVKESWQLLKEKILSANSSNKEESLGSAVEDQCS